ncbi:MAG: TorF family putative porin [Oceanobacter sp.]
MKKLSQAIVAATALTAGIAGVQTANAVEVSASAAVANMYLWRGQDLGNGAAAVSGDITVSEGGLYGGVWASSGDTTYGQEYDLYVGYGGEADALSYDVSLLSYVYPGDDGANGEGNTFGLTDLVVSLGYDAFGFSYYYPVSNSNPDSAYYATLSYGMGDYGLTVGKAGDDVANSGYFHVDLSYAYNDSLGFTVSKIVSDEAEDTADEMDDDIKFVVSYSLPIE